MTSTRLIRHATVLALGLAALALSTSPSFAQTTVSYDLAAVEGTWTAPDGVTTIPMWGFVSDSGSCPLAPEAWVPPQPLTAAAGDTLVINLRNCLANDSTSVFIPGQYKATAPATFVDDEGRTRVRSFDAETATGSIGTYTWDNLKEGTYLFHSGTQPQVQVQMGLYGTLVVTGSGYPPYSAEQVLLYSEIDPELHAAVDLGTYGTAAYPSTFAYYPQYFLINGAAYPETSDVIIPSGQDVLLRFVNAGLKVHTPTLGGGLYMALFAEDGNLYPFAVQQYGVQLAPAKTLDAIVNVSTSGAYALYDRSLGLNNAGATGGGMLTYLQVGGPALEMRRGGQNVGTSDVE